MNWWHSHYLDSHAHMVPATVPDWRPALAGDAIPARTYSGGGVCSRRPWFGFQRNRDSSASSACRVTHPA